ASSSRHRRGRFATRSGASPTWRARAARNGARRGESKPRMTEGKALPTRDRWCLNIGSGLILAGAALAGIGQAFLQDPPAKFWKDWPPAGRAAAAAAGVVVLAGWMALNRRRAAQSVGGLDPRSAPLAGAGVALMMLGFFGQPLLTRWTGLTTPLHVFVAPIVVGMSLYFAAVVVSWDRLKAANPGAAKACARCKTAQVPAGAKCPACGDLGRVREAALV